MLVRDMNQEECRELLVRLGFGRLGCASNNQPYVVPIYFAYESNCLFGFSTAGQKIDWMRTNPLVCIDADEVLGQDNWASVLVFGRYEELLDNPKYAARRLTAHSLLEQSAGPAAGRRRGAGAGRAARSWVPGCGCWRPGPVTRTTRTTPSRWRSRRCARGPAPGDSG